MVEPSCLAQVVLNVSYRTVAKRRRPLKRGGRPTYPSAHVLDKGGRDVKIVYIKEVGIATSLGMRLFFSGRRGTLI